MGCWVLLFSALTSTHAVSYGQTPAPTESRKNKETHAAKSQDPVAKDQRGTDQSPLIIKVLPTPQSEEKATQERSEREDRATNERLLIGANIFLAIFTALLAGFTAKLWWDSRKTAERQLRAYISIEGANEPIIDGQPGELDIHIVMKNVGQSPAFKLNHWVSAGVYHDPLHHGDIFHGQEPDNRQNVYVPPSMLMDLITKIRTPWTRAMLDTDIGDNRCLYVWGEVHYVDVFDNPRFVKFRFMRKPGQGRPGLEYCHEGNDAN